MDCEIHNYLEKKKQLQKKLLDFVEIDGDNQKEFQLLLQICKEQNIPGDRNEFLAFLNLLCVISINHYRNSKFLKNIEQILFNFRDDIAKSFTYYEIFHIFKYSKRIIFFLIQNEMIILDKKIVTSYVTRNPIQCPKYCFYISEMCQFMSPAMKEQVDANFIKYQPKKFNELREIGENDKYICELIRKDLVDEFISYTKEYNISLNVRISDSEFDTNEFLRIMGCPTLIQYAAFFGSYKIFKYLFENCHDVPISIWTYAVHGKNIDLLQFIKQNNIKFKDDYIFVVISNSIKCHHLDVTNYLIQNEIQNHSIENRKTFVNAIESYNYIYFPNENQLTDYDYFSSICLSNNASLVSLILKNNQNNADFDLSKISLYSFVYRSCNDVVKILINSPNIDLNLQNEDKKTPLYAAAEVENTEIAQLLLDNNKVHVNIPDKNNQTPLYVAVKNINTEIVRLLLENSKVDVNLPDKNNKTPLYVAVEVGNTEIVQLLLDNIKVDVNLPDKNNQTPLYVAVKNINTEIVRLLLGNSKVDANLPDKYNQTPLSIAVKNNNIDIIKLLINHPGIDINIVDKYGKKPIDYAKSDEVKQLFN